MSGSHDAQRVGTPTWLPLLVAVVALVIATAALTATFVGRSSFASPGGGMMGGYSGWNMMGGGAQGGAFGGGANGPQPDDAGFVAGTVVSPRIIRVFAGPGSTFSPSSIAVARGETVTFVVTTMGPVSHEFVVGPADAVAADTEGTPEIADIGMMASKSLSYTFDGPGPYAFACHVAGHYEAGMRGTIVVIG